VNLSKPGLSYYDDTNQFHKRIQDWVVNMPTNGFLFPAFNDRSTDIHSILYYSKNPEELQDDFVNQLLGCHVPLSAGVQKESFQAIIQETLGDDCEYDLVKNIHEKLNEIVEDHKIKEIPEPLTLEKTEVKNLFAECGVEEEKLQEFDSNYEKITGDSGSLLATNVINTKSFEVKTPDVVIKVNPERTDLIETKLVDGRRCLVIEISDMVEVNGIPVKPSC